MSAGVELAGRAARADWPRVLGEPGVTAVLRAVPEDFEVEELPGIEPAGDGAHLWLWVEKRGANTPWVADQLARAAGAKGRDAGFAGMKDRHAVTRQWFSVPLAGADVPDWTAWRIEGVRVIDARRHPRKLQRGTLNGNRFRIRLRDPAGDVDGLAARLARIGTAGVPNYFGEQRFGHDGGNVARGAGYLAQGDRPARRQDRRKRGIYLSAVRSALFNEVLARRVAEDRWDRLLPGEIAILEGTRSVFACDTIDAGLERRCQAFDVHPTGPLPGRDGIRPTGDAGRVESEVLAAWPELVAGLAAAGLDAARRSLRCVPAGLECQSDGDDLVLRFELPAGAYATAVLRELVTSRA